MKSISSLLLTTLLVVPCFSSVIECMPVHGVNQYAGRTLVNYTGLTKLGTFYAPHPYEVGAYVPGAANSMLITPQTPLSSKAATTNSSAVYFGYPSPPGWGNLKLTDIGSLFFGSKNARDRQLATNFGQGTMQNLYKSPTVKKTITLKDWSQLTGQISFKCYKDSKTKKMMAQASMTMCGALPLAVYSVHAVGCTSCNTAKEGIFANVPGGLPNIVVTDANGVAQRSWVQYGCPETAKPGGSAFTHISAIYHSDYASYAASFALAGFTPDAPFGYITNIHMFCPMMGELIFRPTDNTLKSCMAKMRRKHYEDDDEKLLNLLRLEHKATFAMAICLSFVLGAILSSRMTKNLFSCCETE